MHIELAVTYIGPKPPDQLRLTIGSAGWDVDQRVTRALLSMEATSRYMGGRRGRRLRGALDDVSARYMAAKLRYLTSGRTLTADEILAINVSDVSAAILPGREPFDDVVKRYMERGFD